MPLDTRPATPQQIGDYDLLEKIAEGGMGTVYKARHRDHRRDRRHQDHPPADRQEPRPAQALRAGVPGRRGPRPPATSSGPSTSAAPGRARSWSWSTSTASRWAKVDREGPMPEDEAIRIIAQVCQGLHRAHKQGLIHRDVKPDNILVTADGDGQADRPGAGQGRRQRPEPDQDRPRAGHAALHGPGAVPQRQERRRPLRHLLARAPRCT